MARWPTRPPRCVCARARTSPHHWMMMAPLRASILQYLLQHLLFGSRVSQRVHSRFPSRSAGTISRSVIGCSRSGTRDRDGSE